MFGKRFVAFCVSVGLVVGGGTAASVLWPSTAGAVGTTHKQTGMIDSSVAVEGSAKFTFQCNDVTGAYKVAFSRIQVIKPDGLTRWTTLDVFWGTTDPTYTHGNSGYVTLVQNHTSGLFGAVKHGTLGDIGSCVTGADVRGLDFDTLENLFVHGTLT